MDCGTRVEPGAVCLYRGKIFPKISPGDISGLEFCNEKPVSQMSSGNGRKETQNSPMT